MKTRDLCAEMRHASAAMTRPDVAELAQYGVAPTAIEIFQMVGLSRIRWVAGTDLYEPDPSGVLAFITPVLVEHPISPESRRPGTYVRIGNIIDLVAWDPETPREWALRTGQADWLGCVPPQYVDPGRVRVWRSILNWFRANSAGLVVLNREPGVAYSLLMQFHGGIDAEDDDHAAELDRILKRPWPLPRISIGRPWACGEAPNAEG